MAMELIPPPWSLRGDIYLFPFYASPSSSPAVSFLYAPLEAQSSFSQGKQVGGLGMVQILRYKASPVGAYDEMLLVPGGVEWAPGRRNPRITRIYVSQRETCYNGRLNWNVPKHLATFAWTRNTVAVYPHTGPDESTPSPRPFFRACFKPIRGLPGFPADTAWVKHLGLEGTLVQPPLPSGEGAHVPGTQRWCAFGTRQFCWRARVAWFDLRQSHEPSAAAAAGAESARQTVQGKTAAQGPGGEAGSGAEAEEAYENFLPGLRRWRLGLIMENAQLTFDKPLRTWSKARL